MNKSKFKILRYLFFILYIFPLGVLISCQNQANKPSPDDDNPPSDKLTLKDCKRCMVLSEQSQPAVDIVDVARGGRIMWAWHPDRTNIAVNKVKWFSHIDDAKPVYNKKYLLVTASSDGLALVRIKDKKTLFYAKPGNNPHSAELLPDGNIVAASSTDNRLVVFHVDTTKGPSTGYRKVVHVPFAHNVVWDKKRKVLWTAGKDKLYSFIYNFNCDKPNLIPQDTLSLPGNNAHDLFPVYDKDALWLTNTTGTYIIELGTMNVSMANTNFQEHIKSVSSGPEGWATIIQKPTKKYWSDRILDFEGNVIFKHPGWKIYKARWFLPNLFSYPKNDKIKVCK